MNLLWILDAPFWQKMFFITMASGVSIFIFFFLEIIKQAKKDFWKWKRNYFENEYPKIKAETDKMVKKMKNKIARKIAMKNGYKSRFRITSIIIACMMLTVIISTLPLALHITPTSNAEAWNPPIGTSVWNGNATYYYANNANSWKPVGVPTTGNIIIFNSTSTYNCAWNLAIADLASFNMNTGWTGTITQQANIGMTGDFKQQAGVFGGNSANTVTVGGNVLRTGGTMGIGTRLIMTGDSTSLTSIALEIRGLTFSNNVSLSMTGAYFICFQLTVATGKTITLSAITTLQITFRSTIAPILFSNNGIITGASGSRLFLDIISSATLIFGTVNIPVEIGQNGGGGAVASSTITLGANTTFASDITIKSYHTTFTMTLDTSANNYELSANDITIRIRGIINARGSLITCSGNLDTANGTLIEESSTILMSGDSKYLKLNNADQTANLIIDGTNTYLAIVGAMISATLPSGFNIAGQNIFSGPGNLMVKAENGNYLGFIREGLSHVSVGDYAVMNLYRSTNNGVTWTFETELVNVSNRDVRNYAGGTTQLGRTFVFYAIYDVDNGTWPNVHYYKYSDDSGITWSAQMSMTLPTIGNFIPTDCGQIYGTLRHINDNGIGISYFCGNDTHTQVRFVTSFDNGVTWNHHKISEPSLIPNCLTEADAIYLGNNKLVALARTDGIAGSTMFTSIDNGITWTDRGSGISPNVRPPRLVEVFDNLGRPWILAVFAYQSIYYSLAYADDIVANGLAAWSTAIQWAVPGNVGGMYATIIWNATTSSGVMMVNYQYAFDDSTLRIINITVSITTTNNQTLANNLTVNSGGSLTFQFKAGVDNFVVINQVTNNGTINSNGVRLNITGTSSTPLTGYGTFDGDIYLNGSVAPSYQVQTGLPMGNLHTDRDTTINLDSSHSLRMIPSTIAFVSVSMASFTRWTVEASDPSTNITFTLSGLDNNAMYKVYIDGIKTYVLKSSDSGTISFTYSGPWSEHEFEVRKYLSSTNIGLITILIIIAISAVCILFLTYPEKFNLVNLIILLVAIMLAIFLLTIAILSLT